MRQTRKEAEEHGMERANSTNVFLGVTGCVRRDIYGCLNLGAERNEDCNRQPAGTKMKTKITLPTLINPFSMV